MKVIADRELRGREYISLAYAIMKRANIEHNGALDWFGSVAGEGHSLKSTSFI